MQDIAEIADCIAMSAGWSLLEVDCQQIDAIVGELSDELAEFDEALPINRYVDTTSGLEASDAIVTGKPTGTKVIALRDLTALPAIAEFLDAARARFSEGPRVILVTAQEGAALFAFHAPHIWSWIGTRHWLMPRDVHTLDVVARLESIRTALPYSDDDIRRMVAEGSLPADPALAEWASLLGIAVDD